MSRELGRPPLEVSPPPVRVVRCSYKRPNYFSRSRPDRRAVAAAHHGRCALRTLAGEPGRHGHRRARAGVRGGLQASASECAPAVCTLAAVGGHSLSAAPLAVRRRRQGECCDEAGGSEGRHDGDGGAEHPQREAEGPRGRGPGGAHRLGLLGSRRCRRTQCAIGSVRRSPATRWKY